MLIHRLIAILVAVSMWTVLVQGQDPSSQETTQTEQGPVIRVVTELVELRVVVTDKKGQPVTDLSQEDFVLLEDGDPQKISFFSAVRIPTAEKLEGDSRTGVAPKRSGGLEEPIPIAGEQPDRTVMLFVDTLHMSPQTLNRVKKSLHKFVDERMTDQDLVAVASTKRTLGVMGQFTRNRQVLGYAIDKLSSGQSVQQSYFTPYLAAQIERGDRQAIQLATKILEMEEGGTYSDSATTSAARILMESSHYRQATLATLKMASDQMASLPGQRLLILYSDGFTLLDRFGTIDSFDLKATINRAVSSGVIIYSIDAKGLQPPPLFDASTKGIPVASDGSDSPGQFSSLFSYLTSSETDLEDGMNALAKDTGGETFFNTNDLTGALGKALDNNRFYYRLGYYPAEEDRGDYGSFTVRVDDHPEYRIRTQRGYSPTEFSKADRNDVVQTPEDAFHAAVLAAVTVTNIGVMARAQFLETELDDAQVSLHLHIEGNSIPLYRESLGRNGRRLALEILTYVIDKDGKNVDGKTHKIETTLPQEGVEQFRQQGLHFTKRLHLEPGLYQVRVGVRHQGTELTGTAASWIEVPDLSRKELALSSIIPRDWSEERDPEDETMRLGTWTSIELKEGFRIYSSGDDFSYFLVVYHGERTNPDSDLLMKIDFLHNGEVVIPGSWQALSEWQLGEEAGGIVVGDQIELTQTTPGIYEFIVSVKKPNSDEVTQRSVTFGISD